MGLRAPEGHALLRSSIDSSCPTAYPLTAPHFILPHSIKIPLQFPPLFQSFCWQWERGSHCCLRKQQSGPTRTVTRPGRRRPWLIKSECGPSSGVGTLGLAGQIQAGRLPPGEVEKIAAWHLAFRLTIFGAEYGWGPTGQDLGSDHNRCDFPIRILYNCLYAFQQTQSSRHWFSGGGWDPVAVRSGCRLGKAELRFFTSGSLFGTVRRQSC